MQLYGLLPIQLIWTVSRRWKKASCFVCSKFSFAGRRMLAPHCGPHIDGIKLPSYRAVSLFPLAFLLVLCTIYVTCCLHRGASARVLVVHRAASFPQLFFPCSTEQEIFCAKIVFFKRCLAIYLEKLKVTASYAE
jgi:hypothetical protein